MFFVLKTITAIACAVAGSLYGTHWIEKLYLQKKEILSFPQNIYNQAEKRRQFLPGILGLIFAFYLLSNSTGVLTSLVSLFLIYFLILFTVTDLEQQVIFDVMLIPFAFLGLFSSVIHGFPLLNHLIAALGGGALFLILAILTRGGIGGGDIKLIAALGLWLGVQQLTSVIILGLIGGGIGALFLLKFRHKKRTDTFAYGPYFTISALLLLFLG